MASERKYILRTVDGEEYGPVDQETLVRWAEAGRVDPLCKVRSTLLNRWEQARDISFLREIIAAQQPVEDKGPTLWNRIKTRATMKAVEQKHAAGLHQRSDPSTYKSASMTLRMAAGITDLFFLFLFFSIIYLFMALLYTNGLNSELCFYLGLTIAYMGTVVYFAGTVSSYSQTLGDKLWGVLVVRYSVGRIFMFRSFVYAICTILFGLLTPITAFISPSGRALQEIVSGTRVVKRPFMMQRQ